MAKGDDSRARNQITYQGNRGAQLGENLRVGTLEPNLNMFRNYFTDAVNRQSGDYNNIMGGYNEFAKTGGFSPTDISAMRARALSPVRAAYANANREVDRSRALSGGYSPGFNVLKARMARDAGTGISDAATNAEANLAEMKQRGRLAGMQGATSLYGTNPGMTSTFAQAVLQSTGQLGQGVANEMGFGNDVAKNQIEAGKLPGKMDSTLQDIYGIGKAGQSIGGAIYPWLA